MVTPAEDYPTEDEADERFVLRGDPEEALRRLLTVPVPPVPEPDDEENDDGATQESRES